MKTLQEITLYFNSRGPCLPVLTYKVKVKKTFEMFGETFAVHRLVLKDDGELVETDHWRVSEVKTGTYITPLVCLTQKAAIESAKEILQTHGEAKTKKGNGLHCRESKNQRN